MSEAVPAVTTIKKAWSKPFRKKTSTGLLVSLDAYWAGNYVAENIDELANLDAEAIVSKVATAPDVSLNRAADRGTGVHSVLEALAAGTKPAVDLIEDDAKPFVEACQRFVDDWRPRWLMTEVVAFNRAIGFAGTCDAVIELPGLGLCVVDWKSRGEKHGAYPEEGCQLGGYASADYYVVTNEAGELERVVVPSFDAGAIVSLCPDGTYQVYPVDIEEAKGAFLALFETWRVRREGERSARRAIGLPLSRPPAGEFVGGDDAHDEGQDDRQAVGQASGVERLEHHQEPQEVRGEEQGGFKAGERRTHYRDRIRVIVEAVAGGALPIPWPSDVPTLKSGKPLSDLEWSLVDRWVNDVESLLSLPFAPPLLVDGDENRPIEAVAAPEPDSAVRTDHHAEARAWAERGRALLSLLDDEALAHACAAIADVESIRMSRVHFLALEAVVTQVSGAGGVLVAHWSPPGVVEVKAVPDIELALIAAMPTTDTVKSKATKGEALRRARNIAKRLGRKSPKSFADLCDDLLLAACVAVGHGVTDSKSTTNTKDKDD